MDLLSAIQRSTDPCTWGFDGNGQLGNGGITNQLSPVQVSGFGPVAALAGGRDHQPSHAGAGGGGSGMAGMTIDATGAWHNLAAFTTAKPQVTNYAYDRLYQLTGVRAPGQETSYTYDPVGNRLSMTSGGITAAYAYDRADRIQQANGGACSTDPNGNLTTGCAGSDGYDALNRLISTTGIGGVTADYTLDGDGNRASKQVEGDPDTHNVAYVHDRALAQTVVLQQVESHTQATITRKFVWGPAGLAYAVDQTGAISVYHTDGLGSVRALTDGSGTVTQTYRTDAFGVAIATQGSSSQPFQYTGQERDENGLVFLRGRVYNPTLGRFMQRDPLAGIVAAPLSLNRYSYALNNPATRTDPSGLSSNQVTNNNHLSLCWDPTGQLQTDCPGPGQVNCFFGGQCVFVPTIMKVFCAIFDCDEGGGGGGGHFVTTTESGEARLLNADRAIIDARKLTDYALNPQSTSGGADKARVFESALGYNQSHYEGLLAQIQAGVSENAPMAGQIDRYGSRFTVDIPVTGPNGSAIVRTGWIYDPGSTVPRLVTLYVK